MNLREQIELFRDGDGLISPYNLEQPGVQKNASGNGVLYLAEYHTLLARRGEHNLYDCYQYVGAVVGKCMATERGLLYRSSTHPDQEGPDDYVGLLVGFYFSRSPRHAQEVIDYGWKHWGFFNNENPGSFKHKDGRFNWSAFLIRQPQLIALAYWAADRKPLAPLVWWTALIIALAGYKRPAFDTDSRILVWLIAQVAAQKSWLCRRAISIFAKRLAKDYPIDENGYGGMTKVFNIAFAGRNPEHPFATLFPPL